ncbi:MAG: glutamine--tRNA ligase/YqeY domain fusion protein [Deltaproteobacteria bacterium]|nr:glutamine--tRNA ligase/YqeY domain fusion protein [Deltaproteobacteria bacterium]
MSDELESDGPGNFVADKVREDLAQGKFGGRLRTRFPPEPNGYLHIGHAKAIVLNFGLAELDPAGRCNLRFDDTNPSAEEAEFAEAIERDLRWLGYEWGEHLYFASDYFEQLYDWAEDLIRRGLAYVDSQSGEQIREGRGDFHRPGVNSPFRERAPEESLGLLRRMRAGEFPEGAHVLRAKIDMQSKDLKKRDPIMYRILHTPHHRTGDAWHIYPIYDWAHGQSDAIEGITHSVCTLEFQNHRPLYEWYLEAIGIPEGERPQQVEFARLNVGFMITSKRKLAQLVEEKHVAGWDDPRMPTLAGMRRRGYTPESIRAFCERIGVAKRDGLVDVTLLEHALREHLNATSPRAMAVLDPIEVVIDNMPEDFEHVFSLPLDPTDETRGTREVPLTQRLYVERGDFMEDPPKKWWRLAPGREVRLRGACLVTVKRVEHGDDGEVTRLVCEWDPDSLGGSAPDGRKVRGTVHWVSAKHAVDAEVRLYDRLFSAEDPGAGDTDFLTQLNPDSLKVVSAKLEPWLGTREVEERVQFERVGYFCVDPESEPGALVFNRTIALRDSWAKLAKKKG